MIFEKYKTVQKQVVNAVTALVVYVLPLLWVSCYVLCTEIKSFARF